MPNNFILAAANHGWPRGANGLPALIPAVRMGLSPWLVLSRGVHHVTDPGHDVAKVGLRIAAQLATP